VQNVTVSNNPYAKFVEGLDVLRSLEETPARIESLVRSWPRAKDEQSHAPGKWKARQVLTHLAQIELMFAVRLRFALAQDNYVVQPFEQDDWMATESSQPALAALDSYVALRRMNLALCRSLTPPQRAKTLAHPEFGVIDVNWLMAWAAGHERNHLPQIETVART
jgi:hypothetical protein